MNNKDVVFVIRSKDLYRAIKQIQANRGRYTKYDLVHVLISAYAATFKAFGTETEYPVNGISPGAAEMPIVALEKILGLRSALELELRVTEGAIACGKATVRDPAITLGRIPDLSVSAPIDCSGFELIVIGRLLGKDGANEQGLTSRLEEATREMHMAISRAAGILADYRVSESDIGLLVEKAIIDAAPAIRKGLSE